jgi:hypothetical protein
MRYEMGAPIEYDACRQSYVYTEEGRVEIGFKKREQVNPLLPQQSID